MTNEPHTPTRRSQAKHQAILAAAVACVEENGYAATTIELIAKKAGVGKQTIYRWWDSKPMLFVEVYASLVDAEELVRSGRLPGLEGMLLHMFALYRSGMAGKILAGLVGEAAAHDTAHAALRAGLVSDRAHIIRDILSASDPDGYDAEIVTDVVVGLVWRALVLEPDRLSDAYARQVAEIALRAGRKSN